MADGSELFVKFTAHLMTLVISEIKLFAMKLNLV